MVDPLPYSESVETIPADEAEDTDRILDFMRTTLRHHLEKTGERRSDVHAKPHACVRAEFRVHEDLPAELAQGLFSRPEVFEALVRFSNTAPWFLPDVVPDGRGLAVQVYAEASRSVSTGRARSTSQDFLMANHATFVAANVKAMLQLEEARKSSGDNPLLLAATLAVSNPNPFAWSWRGLAAGAAVAAQVPAHPADYKYFSMTPIRFGDFVAKYRAVPKAETPSSSPSIASFATQRDPMRHVLEETLLERDIALEFQIQLRTSDEMPIEDATVEWPEEESPYRSVASLVIPRQDAASQKAGYDERSRSFDVWNAWPEHRPLGGINRLRRRVYAESAAWRRGSGGSASGSTV